jgi:hypothetical protein
MEDLKRQMERVVVSKSNQLGESGLPLRPSGGAGSTTTEIEAKIMRRKLMKSPAYVVDEKLEATIAG